MSGCVKRSKPKFVGMMGWCVVGLHLCTSHGLAAPQEHAAPTATASDLDTAGQGQESSVDPAPRGKLVLGAMFDVGVPDGAALSLSLRPFYWLHAYAGGTYNYLAQGVRAGITLAPFDYAITPTLTLDAGHYFSSDISSVMAAAFGDDVEADLFNEMAYSYANGHLGLAIGGDRFRFFLRGGMSYIAASFSGGEVELDEGSSLRLDRGADVNVWTPSAKLGFSLYFL